jgi:hypothetical protein
MSLAENRVRNHIQSDHLVPEALDGRNMRLFDERKRFGERLVRLADAPRK